MPATAQALLAARIDRLSPENKSLVHTAAVIGKDVPYALLKAIAQFDEAMSNSVMAMRRADAAGDPLAISLVCVGLGAIRVFAAAPRVQLSHRWSEASICVGRTVSTSRFHGPPPRWDWHTRSPDVTRKASQVQRKQ